MKTLLLSDTTLALVAGGTVTSAFAVAPDGNDSVLPGIVGTDTGQGETFKAVRPDTQPLQDKSLFDLTGGLLEQGMRGGNEMERELSGNRYHRGGLPSDRTLQGVSPAFTIEEGPTAPHGRFPSSFSVAR